MTICQLIYPLIIIGFTAYVLTTFPPSQLANSVFRLEGEKASIIELAARFKAGIVRVPEIPGEPSKTFLFKLSDKGMCSTGHNFVTGEDEGAGSSNKLWPGHIWKTIKDVHNV